MLANKLRMYSGGKGYFLTIKNMSDGAKVYKSYDGANWTQISTISASYIPASTSVKLAYMKGRWIAVSYDGFATSTNGGITWIGSATYFKRNYDPSITVNRTAGLWLIGAGRFVWRSTDGVTWTESDGTDDSTSHPINDIVINDDASICVGMSWAGYMIRSTNGGSTWAQSTGFVAARNPMCGVYGSDKFVIGGYETASTNRLLAYSTDATSWTSLYAASQRGVLDIEYANGLFVAVSSDGYCATSTTGTSWTNRGVLFNNNTISVVYGNGVWVVNTQSGSVYTSTTGTSGYTIADTITGNYNPIAFGEDD
jgi:hypothetical protein